MRILTLSQPYATLMALVPPAKRLETRSWSTPYRGPVAIHAGVNFPDDFRALCRTEPFKSVLAAASYDFPGELPRGVIVCAGNLVDCITTAAALVAIRDDRMRCGEHEVAFGNYGFGRWAFVTDDMRPLAQPLPYRGAQGLRELPADVAREVLARAGAPR